MTSLVLLLLVVLWGAVFGPAIFRARQQTSPLASVGSFRRGMHALSRNRAARGRWVLTPQTLADVAAMRRQAVVRRRRVFIALLGTSGVTFLGGLLPDLRGLLIVHLVSDATLAIFVSYLLQTKPRARPKHAVRQTPDEPFLEAVAESRRHA